MDREKKRRPVVTWILLGFSQVGLVIIAVMFFVRIYTDCKEGKIRESQSFSAESSIYSDGSSTRMSSGSSVSVKISPNFFHDKLENFLWEYELGDRSFDSGKLGEAIEHFEKSVEVFPTIAGYLALGSVYYAAEKFELARDTLGDAVVLAKEYDLMDSEAGKAAQDLLDVVEAYLKE